jgi:transcriptional regulator with XRE-family HTH domain
MLAFVAALPFPRGSADMGQVVMKGNDFKRWRKSLDMSQKDAADALGLKRRVVQYYEKGERDGEPVKIPRVVRLACYAILMGVDDYHGPEKEKKDKKGKKEKKPGKDGKGKKADKARSATEAA